ncbi:MAG: hypothetical protein HQL54_05340 [Magnetococcales bacterium]|nr:hypothetical protein [Magnetococcales bacterium]
MKRRGSINGAEWIIIFGLFLLIGSFVVALFPDDFWEAPKQRSPAIFGGLSLLPSQSSDTSAMAPAQAQAPVSMVNPQSAMQTVKLQMPLIQPHMQPIAAFNSTVPRNPNRKTKPQQGIVPLTRLPQVSFSGAIQQISEIAERDGQIHVWVKGPAEEDFHISLAPGWFLEYTGCTLAHDIQVRGAGFQLDKKTPSSLIYAKKIVINGKPCLLRNDEGFAFWSNKFR